VRFQEAVSRDVVPGWVDTQTFAVPGLYQVDRLVLDTTTLTAEPYEVDSDPSPISSVPPLGLSPDQRSVVWFTHNGSEDAPVLGVTEWRAKRSYTLPIDRARMRFNRYETLDPAWVLYHFEWQRDRDGVDRLVEKAGVRPLPYRGELTLAKPGEYQSYTLQPARDRMRDVVVGLLVNTLGGTRLPDEAGGYLQRVQIDGKAVHVSVVGSPAYVSVSMSGTDSDPALMTRIAASLDAAMATGQYDSSFTPTRAGG